MFQWYTSTKGWEMFCRLVVGLKGDIFFKRCEILESKERAELVNLWFGLYFCKHKIVG